MLKAESKQRLKAQSNWITAEIAENAERSALKAECEGEFKKRLEAHISSKLKALELSTMDYGFGFQNDKPLSNGN